ncbi:probable G-protein coupled receptor 139 [Narcine bancroftii]|uniref:probable G-protein coupled receptor 139 n=1 Tax=Narcine bancroftii TaxID=1343680 RepID=UPI003831E933
MDTQCRSCLCVYLKLNRSGNLMAIVMLSRGKCGLSKCITRYLVGMAVSDLLCAIIGVVVDQINNIYNYSRYLLITPICALTLAIRLAVMDCSVWLTVAFTFDRCIAICSQRLRKSYCTKRIATVVTVIVVTVTCARYVPSYFTVGPYVIINQVPWRCMGTAEFFTSPLWKVYTLFTSIATPLLPIGLIVLFNALTVSHIIAVNKKRRRIRNHRENQKDPEAENRRKTMILLFALSANFIVLWIPCIVFHLNWSFQNYFYQDRYFTNPTYVLQQFANMLQFLSTCTNTCIYTLSQRKFREELKKGLNFLIRIGRNNRR